VPGPGSGVPEHQFHSKSEAKRVAEQKGSRLCDICGKRLAVTMIPFDYDSNGWACKQCAEDLKDKK
jgi:hypothetical protein